MIKRYVIVCSFAELIYSLYIYHRLKKKKINPELIFLHSSVAKKAKYILKKEKIKYHICEADLPTISFFSSLINFIKTVFYPFRILLHINKIKKYRKRFKKSIVLYTQGNHIAFEAIHFLNNFKAKKIINVDALLIKPDLLSSYFQKKKIRLIDHFKKKILVTYIHFYMSNFFSGNMCKYWHNGYFYRYYKFKEYPNEIELKNDFYQNAQFKSFFINFTKRKTKKNSIIFLLTEAFDVNQDLEIFKNFLLSIDKKNYTVFLKFHPDTTEVLKKEIFKYLKEKIKFTDNIKIVILLDTPIEFLDIIPTYVIGFPSNAFRYPIAKKKNITLLPTKFSGKYIIWKNFKKSMKPFNDNMIYIEYDKYNKILKKIKF